MTKIKILIWRFRSWLFKLIFGINPKHVLQASVNYKFILQVLDQHQDYLNSISATLSELDNQTGGKGWVEMVQEAIMNLSQRSDAHRLILQQHQEAVEQIAEFEVIHLDPQDKTNLN